jgi:hypothetical protein
MTWEVIEEVGDTCDFLANYNVLKTMPAVPSVRLLHSDSCTLRTLPAIDGLAVIDDDS